MRNSVFFHLFAGAVLLLGYTIPFQPSQVATQGALSAQTPTPTNSPPQPPQLQATRTALSVVVLDAAHGGADPGARGVGGLRESEIVATLASGMKMELEKFGFQVVLTRQGNDDPSFDDRSRLANAQRGAIFITLHVGSTGLSGTARVYAGPGATSSVNATGGFLPWDRAQAPFLPLSRRLADLVQGELAQRFKGSPNASQTAPVRQLRTIAAPAIAIELSSVSVEDRSELDRMLPGVAENVARAVAAFKPTYDASPPGGMR